MANYTVTFVDREGKQADSLELTNVAAPTVQGGPNAPLIWFQQQGTAPPDPPVAVLRYDTVRSIVIKT